MLALREDGKFKGYDADAAMVDKARAWARIHAWAKLFCRRHDLVNRRKTKEGQVLPKDAAERLQRFRGHVLKMRKRHGIEAADIINADQTPVWFDAAGNYTLETRGARTCFIQSNGKSKQRVTVMLAAAADGRKLPPHIIFKGSSDGSIAKSFQDDATRRRNGYPLSTKVILSAQKKAWFDQGIMRPWVKEVLQPAHTGGVQGGDDPENIKKNLVVLDAFSVHRAAEVMNDIRKAHFCMSMVPGGVTSVCQPADTHWNKPFKAYLRQQFNEHLLLQQVEAGETLMRPPTRADIAWWVGRAWDNVNTSLIVASFLHNGISNALDGSQDALITENSADVAAEIRRHGMPADGERLADENADAEEALEEEEQDVIVQSVSREEYEVEKITRKRKRGRGYQFYVKWGGWKDPTWEPAHKLKNCAALDAFEARHGGPSRRTV